MSFTFADFALIDGDLLSNFIWGVNDASSDVTVGMSVQTRTSVELLINSISRQIMRHLSLDIKLATYTEVWDGAASDFIVPRMYPVQSIAIADGCSVKIAPNGDWTNAVAIPDNEVFTDGYQLKFRNIKLPFGRGLMKVVYKAGWDTVPEDIQHAVLLQFQWAYKTLLKGDAAMVGVSQLSKGVGGGSETVTKDATLGNFGLRTEVIGMLKDYKRFEAPLSVMFARMS